MPHPRRSLPLITLLAAALIACGDDAPEAGSSSWELELPAEAMTPPTTQEEPREVLEAPREVAEEVEMPRQEEAAPMVNEAPERPRSPLATCELEPLWWQGDATHRLTPAVFDWTPDASALVQGAGDFGEGWSARRGRDGVQMLRNLPTELLSVSTNWELTVLRERIPEQGERVVARRGLDGPIVWTAPEHFRHAVVSADGERVAALACGDGEARPARLSVWELGAGAELASVALPDYQCYWYQAHAALRISPRGEHVALTTIVQGSARGPAAPELRLLSLRGGEPKLTSTTLELSSPEQRAYHGQLAEVRFHPDGDTLSIIGANGERLLLDVETVDVRARQARGAFVSNLDTYLPPLPASPLAWSPQGDVEASVAPDGAVELRRGEGPPLARLFAPEAPTLGQWWDAAVENPPIAVSFSPEGDRVAASFRMGLGVWGCADAAPTTPEDALGEIEVEAPARVAVGEAVAPRITFDEDGAAGHLVAYRLLVDGELRHSALTPALRWTPYEEGTYELVVVVDDGQRTARSAPLTIEVR